MIDFFKAIGKYFGSRPTNGIDLAWRIVLITILCLTLLRLERIRRGQLDTQQQVREIATAVATEQASAPPVGSP